MRAAGLAEAALMKLVCPIGLAGIAGKDPAVIAASTAAQLLMAGDNLAAEGAGRAG
jgi:xanthine dehydrogenase accessory factor